MDALSNGVVAHELAKVPANFLPMALEKLGWTADQFDRYSNNWQSAGINAGILMLSAIVMRGVLLHADVHERTRRPEHCF